MSFARLRKLVRIPRTKRKRNLTLFTALSIASILGHVFFVISWVSGFVIARLLGGKETGKRGRIPSVIFTLGQYRLHLHHWVICCGVMAFALLKDSWFHVSDWFFGLLAGIVFQGIYSYRDWYRILFRHKRAASQASPQLDGTDSAAL